MAEVADLLLIGAVGILVVIWATCSAFCSKSPAPPHSVKPPAKREATVNYADCRCCTGKPTTVKEITEGLKKFKDDPTGTIVVLIDGVWRDDLELYVAGGKTNSAKDKIQQRIRGWGP